MSATLASITLLIVSYTIFKSFWIISILFLLLLLFSKNNHKIGLFSAFVLILLRLNTGIEFLPFEIGRIVELNQNSVLIQKGIAKELVVGIDVQKASLGDLILVTNFSEFKEDFQSFGFKSIDWAQANHIIGKVDYVQTIQKANLLLRFISYESEEISEFQGWYRAILFQVNHESVVGVLFSLGLLFSALIQRIERILKKLKHKDIIVFSLIVLFLYTLGQPLALIRIFIFRLIKKFNPYPQNNFFISVICLFFLSPYGLTQLAWVLPLALSFSQRFSMKEYKTVIRSLVLSSVFLSFSLRFGLIYSLIYSQFKKIVLTLVALLFIARFIPFMQIYFCLLMEKLSLFIQNLNELVYINGHLSLLSFLIILVLYQFRLNKSVWIICFIFIILAINPLSIIPYFDQITMINVGQGDSFLFQSAFNQEVILLDTGNVFAESKVLSALNYYGINTIDELILTHEDADHSANLEAICENVKVNYIITEGIDIPFSKSSLKYLNIGNFDNVNDNSLIYYLHNEGKSFLFLADVSTLVEKELIKQYPNLTVDFIKLAHHGSKTSTSLDLLHQIKAEYALLSVGENNYGHPSYKVIEALSNYHIRVFNSLEKGDVVVRMFRNILWISSSSGDNFISLTQ